MCFRFDMTCIGVRGQGWAPAERALLWALVGSRCWWGVLTLARPAGSLASTSSVTLGGPLSVPLPVPATADGAADGGGGLGGTSGGGAGAADRATPGG